MIIEHKLDKYTFIHRSSSDKIEILANCRVKAKKKIARGVPEMGVQIFY